MRRLLLLDFDHTLFDTAAFWPFFAQSLALATGEPPEALARDYSTFSVGSGRTRHTDFQAMLAAHHITAPEVARALGSVAAGHDFLYSDARELLSDPAALQEQYDVEILTFGDENFQAMKIGLVPQLESMRAHIVHELKADYISRALPGRSGVLVDDTPHQELGAGWIEVNIDRTRAPHAPIELSPTIFRISDLRDLSNVLAHTPA